MNKKSFGFSIFLDGEAYVDWIFVDDKDVEDGPWKKIITTSDPAWD